MPNHVTNIITLSGDKRSIDRLLEQIKRDEFGIGTIDFNKIVPMPDDIYRGDLSIKEMELYGDKNWYDWCINNWQTKWNAYGYSEDHQYDNSGKLSFYTAWSAPHPVIEKLSEMFPDIKLEHEWADEDIGMNCGRYVYYDGERIEEYFPESNKERLEFAAGVMDIDLSDYGLFLNASETDYIYLPDEEFEVIEIAGQTALFTNRGMIDANVPKGLHCYHLRDKDDGSGFGSLEKYVTVNHGGSVITREPIDLGEKGYIHLDNDSSPNFTGEEMLMEEFMTAEDGQSENMEMEM